MLRENPKNSVLNFFPNYQHCVTLDKFILYIDQYIAKWRNLTQVPTSLN